MSKELTEYTTERNYQGLSAVKYPTETSKNELPTTVRVVQESSAVGTKGFAALSGGSFLWIGEHVHLSRDGVKELVGYLQQWLETGELF